MAFAAPMAPAVETATPDEPPQDALHQTQRLFTILGFRDKAIGALNVESETSPLANLHDEPIASTPAADDADEAVAAADLERPEPATLSAKTGKPVPVGLVAVDPVELQLDKEALEDHSADERRSEFRAPALATAPHRELENAGSPSREGAALLRIKTSEDMPEQAISEDIASETPGADENQIVDTPAPPAVSPAPDAVAEAAPSADESPDEPAAPPATVPAGNAPLHFAKFEAGPSALRPQPANEPQADAQITGEMRCEVRRSQLMRVPFDVQRVAIGDSNVCDVVRFAPREFSIIGKEYGSTRLTMWFHGDAMPPVTYNIHVGPGAQEQRRLHDEYQKLTTLITEMYPTSQVTLIPAEEKLIVQGKVDTAQQAREIMALIRKARLIPVVDQIVVP